MVQGHETRRCRRVTYPEPYITRFTTYTKTNSFVSNATNLLDNPGKMAVTVKGTCMTLVSLSLRLKNLQGPVTRVKKKKKGTCMM